MTDFESSNRAQLGELKAAGWVVVAEGDDVLHQHKRSEERGDFDQEWGDAYRLYHRPTADNRDEISASIWDGRNFVTVKTSCENEARLSDEAVQSMFPDYVVEQIYTRNATENPRPGPQFQVTWTTYRKLDRS